MNWYPNARRRVSDMTCQVRQVRIPRSKWAGGVFILRILQTSRWCGFSSSRMIFASYCIPTNVVLVDVLSSYGGSTHCILDEAIPLPEGACVVPGAPSGSVAISATPCYLT
jgi:hypothetical protein